ncbi:E3 ubiquitin ligase involved in syntaxin degradation [Handroanthus impetiginosus]|uniref:E3 ubiquitin ligase involved in syntaxin degradation n=1 Tax=Handroanthus impetiginosus TaxID=429701 RepID=A0A2G9FXA7_9LAMI|nr:E3 ubiquitin ligase involved in syntaxin degradation [Handroanthus impetiginosus]
MAKKKVSQSHQEKPQQKQEGFVKPNPVATPVMDSEAPEKIENLKSLNQMLLKEAVERRQRVDALVHSKESLEMELTRSNSEKEALKSELAQLGERAASLELERTVVAVFVAVQVGQKAEVIEQKMKGLEMEMRDLKRVIDEKENEIGGLNKLLSEIEDELGNEKEVSRRVCFEKDEIKDNLERQIKEGKDLRANLIEIEERKGALEREIGELRGLYDVVVGKKEERDMRIESITSEKDSIERSLAESNKLIEELKEELNGIVQEKKRTEEEKNLEMVKRQELEKSVSGLREVVNDLRNEDERLRANVAELEKKCVEGEERQREMEREIDQLVEEKKLSERRIEGLVDEKSAVKKDFDDAQEELAEQKHKIEELVNEKALLLEAKGRLDGEVDALRNEVSKLKNIVLKLEESSLVEVGKIKSLESEVGEYRSKFEEVKVEKDEMEKCLDDENRNAIRLNQKIQELENKIEESLKAVEEVKAESVAILAEKVELESQCVMLKKEITSLENTITEARNEFDSVKGKFELADANSELLLNMLKDTATFCSKDERDLQVGDKETNGETTKPYVMEFEMIKNAFKSKESKVENMKRQLELLRHSVEEAQKKKNFWTVWSSATTLLAAFSLAYVARGH